MDHHDMNRWNFKHIMPILLVVVGVIMLITSQFTHTLIQDTDEIVANLVGLFLLIGGCGCTLAGLITYFLKDEHQFWS